MSDWDIVRKMIGNLEELRQEYSKQSDSEAYQYIYQASENLENLSVFLETFEKTKCKE